MNKINEFFTNAVNMAKTKAIEFLNSVINVMKKSSRSNWKLVFTNYSKSYFLGL